MLEERPFRIGMQTSMTGVLSNDIYILSTPRFFFIHEMSIGIKYMTIGQNASFLSHYTNLIKFSYFWWHSNMRLKTPNSLRKKLSSDDNILKQSDYA